MQSSDRLKYLLDYMANHNPVKRLSIDWLENEFCVVLEEAVARTRFERLTVRIRSLPDSYRLPRVHTQSLTVHFCGGISYSALENLYDKSRNPGHLTIKCISDKLGTGSLPKGCLKPLSVRFENNIHEEFVRAIDWSITHDLTIIPTYPHVGARFVVVTKNGTDRNQRRQFPPECLTGIQRLRLSYGLGYIARSIIENPENNLTDLDIHLRIGDPQVPIAKSKLRRLHIRTNGKILGNDFLREVRKSTICELEIAGYTEFRKALKSTEFAIVNLLFTVQLRGENVPPFIDLYNELVRTLGWTILSKLCI